MDPCKILISELLSYLSSEFECFIDDQLIGINTPFLYSDGDQIQLFIQQYEKMMVISDLGETARKMDAYSFNWNSPQAKNQYTQILKTNNIESQNHILRFTTDSLENMGYKIFDLIHAIQQKENLLVLRKPFKQKNFKDDVEIYLLEKGFVPESDIKIDGESGNEYQIDFYLNHNSNILLKALSSASDTGDKDQISRTYTSYSDIKLKHKEYRRAVILDDKDIKWDQNQKNLLSQIIDIPLAFWSTIEEFTDKLQHIQI